MLRWQREPCARERPLQSSFRAAATTADLLAATVIDLLRVRRRAAIAILLISQSIALKAELAQVIGSLLQTASPLQVLQQPLHLLQSLPAQAQKGPILQVVLQRGGHLPACVHDSLLLPVLVHCSPLFSLMRLEQHKACRWLRVLPGGEAVLRAASSLDTLAGRLM